MEGVHVKINRAEEHQQALHDEFARLFPGDVFHITPEIYDNGHRHVYRALHPPVPDHRFSALVGDCIHNLRTALDHLAYQLVRACGGTPNIHTQFPIRDNPPIEKHLWLNQRTLPDISPGVSVEVRKELDAVQPYSQPGRFHGLDVLRDLDNIDKHRELVIVVGAVGAHVSAHFVGSPEAPPGLPNTQWTRHPLQHGEVMAILTYDHPYHQPDPQLKFIPHPAFADFGPVPRDRLWVVLIDLLVLVQDDVLPRFIHFFGQN